MLWKSGRVGECWEEFMSPTSIHEGGLKLLLLLLLSLEFDPWWWSVSIVCAFSFERGFAGKGCEKVEQRAGNNRGEKGVIQGQ